MVDMNKYEKPMIYISEFDKENVVTTSSIEQTNTYAANELNKAMFANGTNGTTTLSFYD